MKFYTEVSKETTNLKIKLAQIDKLENGNMKNIENSLTLNFHDFNSTEDLFMVLLYICGKS